MQANDVGSLIAELSASLSQSPTANSSTILQQKIAPLLTANLQQTIANPVVVAPQVISPVVLGTNKVNLASAFAVTNTLLTESPLVFKSIRESAVITPAVKTAAGAGTGIGASLSNLIQSGIN